MDNAQHPSTRLQVLAIDDDGIEVSNQASDEHVALDIAMSGHRIWSVTVPPGAGVHRWPDQLARRLHGTGEVAVRRSDSGELVAERVVVFGGGSGALSIVDEHGRWLAVNKWGNLGVPIDGRDPEFAARLLDRSERLVAELVDLGYEPFVCSGSLLGALRTGSLLPHDDDVDLGFLAAASHPSELNLTSYRMQRELERLGHLVVRHSGTHLQITYLLDDGAVDHYIDIFTGYFRGEEYSQPFAMRGRMPREDLVPFSTVQLDGRTLPAPARPESWLELCYGPGWRVPDPAFSFDVPRSTIRRFEAWFGSFNHGRDYWEARHRAEHGVVPPDQGVVNALGDAEFVVDLGAGGSGLVAELQGRVPAIAVDFSVEAAARQLSAGVRLRCCNFNDRREVLELIADVVARSARPVLVLDGVLEWLRPETRENLRLLLLGTLRRGGRAIIRIREDEAVAEQSYIPGAGEWVRALGDPFLRDETDEFVTLRMSGQGKDHP